MENRIGAVGGPRGTEEDKRETKEDRGAPEQQQHHPGKSSLHLEITGNGREGRED
jgi:hypothetical protein